MTGTQKVAIVTGASRGIGKASALALMKEGYAWSSRAGASPSGRRRAEGSGTPQSRSSCRPM